MDFRAAARHFASEFDMADKTTDSLSPTVPAAQDHDRITSEPDPETDGQDPATPGGPSPYNGAAPFSEPVVTDPLWRDPTQPRNPRDKMPFTPGPDVDVSTLHRARRLPDQNTMNEVPMSSELWIEAAGDVDAENNDLAFARAKVAVAKFWPYFSLANSVEEFDHRLSLTASRISEIVGEPLTDRVLSSLREDFVTAYGEKFAARQREIDDYNRRVASLPQPGTEYLDKATGQWVKVAASDAGLPQQPDTRNNPFGNPDYFDGATEEGPNTGSTGQFAQFPAGPDPVDPLSSMFPMQPSQWMVPPDKQWVENPMNFSPPEGRHAARSVNDFRRGDKVRVKEYEANPDFPEYHLPKGHESVVDHTTEKDDDGNSWVAVRGPNFARDRDDYTYTSPDNLVRHRASRRTAVEGVEGRPGPNPDYFAGGSEGIAGTEQNSFPADLSLPEPDERVDMYGTVPPQQSSGSTGGGVPYSNPGVQSRGSHRHTAPGGGEHAPYRLKEESDGWYVVNAKGEKKSDKPKSKEEARQQQKALYKNVPGARESAEKAASRLPQFFDPTFLPAHLAVDVRGRPTANDPTGGVGDEYELNTWENASATRPTQPPEQRGINTPQRPGQPIQETTSTGFDREDDEDDDDQRRFASLDIAKIAEMAVSSVWRAA